MTETTTLDVVAEAPVKKKEVERGNKVLVTPLYGVKGTNDARGGTRMGVGCVDWGGVVARRRRRARVGAVFSRLD